MTAPTEVDPAAVDEVVLVVVGAIAPVPVDRVEPRLRLTDDLGYVSIVLVQLVVALEDLFELEWEGPDDVLPLETVADLQTYVRAKLGAGLGGLPEPDHLAAFLDSL